MLACLGPEANGSDFLIEQLLELEPVLDSNIDWLISKTAEKAELWLRSELNERVHEDMLEAFDLLGRKSFWGRVWILPELFTAKDLLLLYGSCMFSWRVLDNFFLLSRRRLHTYGSSAMNMVCQAKRDVSPQISSEEFLELVWRFSGWECSDPRDRIYAFLHMVTWGQNKNQLRLDLSILRNWNPIVTRYVGLCTYGVWDAEGYGNGSNLMFRGLELDKLWSS